MILLALLACVPDDWDGSGWPPDGVDTDGVDTDGVDDTEPVDGPAIVGDWISEGADLSDLFAGSPFNYVRIEASFGADGRCGSVIEAANGDVAETAGTCALTEGSPGTIVVSQTDPYAATAVGIWQVRGGVLTYEVVQTVPDYGYAPPTPASGFGSTEGTGLGAGVNVQTYRRAP